MGDGGLLEEDGLFRIMKNLHITRFLVSLFTPFGGWGAVFYIAILLNACSQAEGKKTETAKTNKQEVFAKTSALQEIKNSEIPIVTSGILTAKTQTELAFKIGGIIQKIYVEEGQFVGQGQVLAILDKGEIDAQVAQAKSALEKSQRDLKRAENLYKDTVATLEQVQNAKTGLEVANSSLKVAQFNQKYAAIYAPTSGKVLKKFAENGELIGPGNPVLQIASEGNAMVVRVGVSDRDVVKINMQDRAEVSFDAYEGEIFEAFVSDIAETANPRTSTYEVELTLKATGKVLKDGFIANVKIFPQSNKTYYKVPMNALLEADKKQGTVFIPKSKNTVKKVAVKIEEIGKDYIVIDKSSFPEGTKEVVTSGVAYISEEAEVKFLNK